MESRVGVLLNNTLSGDGEVRLSATQALDDLSLNNPNFPFALVSIAISGETQGQSIAAATYLKNFTRRRDPITTNNHEFRDLLVRSLLQPLPTPTFKLLIEAFRPIVDAEFVKQNSWPQLVPHLKLVIQDSDLVVDKNETTGNSTWKTVNALTLLQSVIRPFQYFLNPKLAKEPVPPQLELITHEILVPMISFFHQFVQDLCVQNKAETEEALKSLLIMSKCIYYSVRSHMPSALVPLLPSLCHDLIHILQSLKFQNGENAYTLRLKAGKRSLLIFCALITRHRKFCDKLMPDIINSVVKLLNLKMNFSKLDNLAERVVSLAFDVISRLLETGPGWRLVSPHFSSLLESAIFPAIILNEKDVTEWEEDSDEYIRKNLPTEFEEISGLREDLYTPRKSALNLLGVISISKGPPVVSSVASKRKKGEKNKQKGRSSMGELLVLPFLSKFPVPSSVTNTTINDYYGVLMAYGSLVDFLTEQKPAYTSMLIQSRVLPLYNASFCHPYLVASANWILGELVSCLPQEMSSDVYSSLLKALVMEDTDISYYPVRVSAAGALAQLAENEFNPPNWLPVLQVVVDRIKTDNVEEETSIMFELLKTIVEAGSDAVAPHIPHIISLLAQHIVKHIPLVPEPWPQVVVRGIAALSVMAQYWEGSLADDEETNNVADATARSTIAKAFTDLLQVAWLASAQNKTEDPEYLLSSCIDDSSALLTFIMSDINEIDAVQKQTVSKLLLIWAGLISNYNSWEEEEDSSIFSCIKEAAHLHKKVTLTNFICGSTSQPSIIEGICGFVSNAFSQYPSVIYRASSSVHILLHVLTCSREDERIMNAVTASFTRAAFSCFKEKRFKQSHVWKPLLLAICSCYLCYPEIVEKTLEEEEHEGLKVWVRALFSISSTTFEHGLSTESEIKLTVMTLAKLMSGLHMRDGLLWECLAAVMEASVRLKQVQENNVEDTSEEDNDHSDEEDSDDDDDDDDDDDEDDVHEETEEEFLERCAQAAIGLENGTGVEEVDEEDHEEEIELGELDGVDALNIVKSLMERHHQILLQGPKLPQQLVLSFVDAFPETAIFFKQYLP